MKKKLAETTVILIATIKWSAIAAVVGGAVGLSTTAFLKSLSWAIDLTGRYQYYFVFLPLAFLLSSFLVRYLAPEAEGHGTEKVIEAIHRRSARISAAVIPVKLVASVITIASGGSAGKEGPCAQIGGGVSSAISNLFNLSDESRKKLVICGISAGFASVFGTPVAGAIFGVEVLFIGSILYDVLLPSFISGIVSYHVSAKFGILFFSHPIESLAVFSRALLIKVILMGCLFGLVSFILIEAMNAMDRLSSRIKIPSPAKALIGGLSLVFLALIFSTQFLGLGLETIESTLMSGKVVWYAFIMKIIFTAITLNFGGSGGVITPIFFIGATSGAAFAGLLGMDGKVFSA
ncbi:MAG: chloride channel protein, partial [bacterium]